MSCERVCLFIFGDPGVVGSGGRGEGLLSRRGFDTRMQGLLGWIRSVVSGGQWRRNGGWSPPPLISGEAPLFLASKIFFKPLPKGVLCWEIEFCILKKLEPPPIRKRLPTPLGEDHIQPSIRILLLLKAKPPSVTAAFFWKSQQLLLCFEAKWSL